MAARSGAFTIGARALQAMVKGAAVTLPVAILYSLLITIIDTVPEAVTAGALHPAPAAVQGAGGGAPVI